MYFVFYFITGILLLGFILIKFLEIVFDRRGYTNTANKVYAALLFLVMVATFINIILAVYSYRNTVNMTGSPGSRGIRGNKGKKGTKGMCDEKCGQKVCYVELIDHANAIFKREVEKALETSDNLHTKLKKKEFKIKNGFFLDKINSICKSEQYQTTMLGKHPKKPSEKKLIEYIEGIIEEWIVFLISDTKNIGCLTDQEYTTDGNKCNDKSSLPTITDADNLIEKRHRGVRFLLAAQYTPDVLNYKKGDSNYNPIDEFKKYDIWNWGNGLKINPLEIKVNTKILELPEPDQARLQITKSNNYQWVFDTKTNKDKWDDTKCDYYQMGEDKTNPQNLSRCVYINQNNKLKDYVNTWKTDVYNKGPEISLYNADSYMDNETHQEYYPVGSVWRGTETKDKPKGSVRSPPSKNSCGIGHGKDGTSIANGDGPEKETILVSGDVKKPEKMDLIWNNKSGCSDCQITPVNIFRPVAPKGYICLGDYAKNSNVDDTDLEKIRCVPEECVREKRLGNKFYDNKNISYDKYNSYKSYTGRVPIESDRQLTSSLWAAGMDNVGTAEEQENNYGLEYTEDSGYNLFRTGRGLRKPDMKTYVIKEECLIPGGGVEPKHPVFDASEYLRKTDTDNRYNTKEYFGDKPPFAILTNNHLDVGKSLLNFKKKPIRLYLEDDLTTRKDSKSDTYFIKTFNPKKNDFSMYVVANMSGKIELTENVSKKNNYHRWEIQSSIRAEDYTFSVNIISHGLKSDTDATSTSATNKHLVQYYDNMGKSKFELTDMPAGTNTWIYNTMIKSLPPQYI
jgi:hypothetical protein